MNKKKILFVFHNSDIQSGASRSLMDIVDGLSQSGKYEISAILPKPGGSAVDILDKKGIKTYLFKYGNLMQSMTQPLAKRIIKIPLFVMRHLGIAFEADKAYKLLKSEKIDFIYNNTSTIIFGGILGKKLHARMIWHIREFGLLDHQIKFYLGESWMERFINVNADAVFTVSEAVKNYHSKNISPNKMYVTYNSYSQNYIDPKETFNENNRINILLAGDVKPSKGQLEAIQAMKIVLDRRPDSAVLHLAGRLKNNGYKRKLDTFIENNQLQQNVVFYGQVSKMKELRAKMDVGIVPSRNEAFGRTTIEGMLSMLCMIGRNSGGTTEQIKHSQTGLLYDGSVEDLAEKLVHVIDNRKDMIKMAKQGFIESVELHTKGKCVCIVDEVLSSFP